MKRKVVIIGGVAGGATAAARIRRLDESAEIVVFERSGYVSYANCGLPYYIGGVIEDAAELTLQTPQSFRDRFHIDVRVRHEVLSIHPAAKMVRVRDLSSGREWDEPYDALLLSPGAHPAVPDIPGAGLPQVFTLRTVEDMLAIRAQVEKRQAGSAIISGGGFIGLELAENLVGLGLEVTVVQRPTQVMKTLDADMASFVHARIRKAGIRLVLGDSVAAMEADGDGVKATLKGGRVLSADLAVLAIGVVPESSLARAAGLQLGLKGSILVDDHMRTSAPGVYAVGDAVQVKHLVTGADAVISLAGPANRQGRIAADNICGLDSAYPGSQGSSVMKLFDLTVASTGVNEAAAKVQGLDYDKVCLSPLDHAGYYPGGKAMTLKVLFERTTGKLLGAQAVGYGGVDKRIDVLATAMYAGVPAPKLKELDLAYAPPYSSAKDPVNMVGFMVENIRAGLLRQFFYEDLAGLPRDGSVTLLDTRTPAEYARGHVEGFANVPLDELRGRLGELDAGKAVYVMCQSGLRSYLACRILAQNGFDCRSFSGGYRLYESVALEAEAAAAAYPCGALRE